MEKGLEEGLMMFTLRNDASPPITIDLQIEGKNMWMELDTGAAVSIIGKKKAQEISRYQRCY